MSPLIIRGEIIISIYAIIILFLLLGGSIIESKFKNIKISKTQKKNALTLKIILKTLNAVSESQTGDHLLTI